MHWKGHRIVPRLKYEQPDEKAENGHKNTREKCGPKAGYLESRDNG